LLRTGPVAAEEELDIDNPIIQMHFREVLRKIIQKSSQTWEVIRYLSHLKEICPGFEYRIKKDSHGPPEGMCWMFLHMRCDLLRYGNILFLMPKKTI
jgi:hypothetical protein